MSGCVWYPAVPAGSAERPRWHCCGPVRTFMSPTSAAPALDELMNLAEPSSADRLHRRRVDIANREQVEDWIDDIQQRHGRIDVLVHCAANVQWKPVDQQSVESILLTMEVGFHGLVYCTKRVLPIMQSQDFGRIVCISSVASTIQVFSGYAAYASMKAATDAWARILRIDLHGTNIGVTNIRPGIVKHTRFFENSIDRRGLPRLLDLMPATTPEAVARVVLKSIHSPSRTYVIPISYRFLEWAVRLMPRLSEWLCRFGESRRTDLRMRGDQDP